MKLLKLNIIDQYKNLSGVYDFSENNGYIALIGLNGSGKSNLLEAVSLIFNGLFNKKKIPFDYEIEYEINNVRYIRGKNKTTKDNQKVNRDEIQYPSSIITCYSGEDLRLWHRAYEDYHNHYFNSAIKNQFEAQRLLYINKYCWAIALVSLLASDNNEYIKNMLNINNIDDVVVSFDINELNKETFKQHDACKWFNRIEFEEGTVNLNELISYDILSDSPIIKKQTKSKNIFQFLYLLSQPKKNKINKVDKLITDINIKIGNISLSDLSEGEKKIILIECITKVLADENSLILLDEPDAHVHISRKIELLNAIASFKGQTVLTTHSPTMFNQQDVNNIFYLNDGKIENKNLLKKIHDLSGGVVNYFEGAFLICAKKILVVEGKSDRDILKQAIKRNADYKQLEDVYIYPMYSAGNVADVYNNILKKYDFDRIVFLFDYDQGGYEGWKAVKKLRDKKVSPLFYQNTYEHDLNPKEINSENTVLIEDLFPPEAYSNIIRDLQNDFNNRTTFKLIKYGNRLDGENKIKKYLEENCKNDTCEDEWFNNFEPLLKKLKTIYYL